MAEPITVKVSVNQLGKQVYEVCGVMSGKFYKRLYIGYNKPAAIKLFEAWLKEQQ